MRSLKIFLAVLLALLLLLTGAVAVVWNKPELLLNEKNVKWALGKFAPTMNITWKEFSWKIEPDRSFEKRSILSVGGLCVKSGAEIEGCAPRISLDLTFSLRRLKLSRIRAVAVDLDSLTYVTEPSSPSALPISALPDLRLPGFAETPIEGLDLSLLEEFRLKAEKFTLRSKGSPDLVIKLALEKEGKGGESTGLRIDGALDQGKDLEVRLKAKLLLQQDKLAGEGEFRGKFDSWRVEAPLKFVWGEGIELSGVATASSGQEKLTSPLKAVWTPKKISLDFEKLLLRGVFSGMGTQFEAFRVESMLDSALGYPKHTTLKGDVTLNWLKHKIFPPLRISVDSDIRLEARGENGVAAEIQLKEKGKNDYVESVLDFSGKGEFDLKKSEVLGQPEIKVTGDFSIPSLQRWKKLLEGSPLSVPAPFRTLDGPITLNLGLEKSTADELGLLAKLKTELKGPLQTMITDSLAHVTIVNPWRGAKKIKIDAEAQLTQVNLEAPPLKLEEPPPLFADSRFHATKEAPKAEKPSNVSWALKLTTGQPLQLRTNLLESALPVALDLRLGSGVHTQGSVEVQPFNLTVFKKKAQLKFLKLAFSPGSDVAEVNGLLEHRTTEVLIKILLLGASDKLRVDFQSEPPLTRAQIVSVLLYNKSLAELTEEESSSSASFSQATADGALGLFSLLFLSSTPIQSINYDAASQAYSVRFRLGGKTSVSVGSDFAGERQVGLRRRLSGNWSLSTEFKGQEAGGNIVLTMIEWFKRF